MRVSIPVNQSSEFFIPKQFARLYDLAYNLWWSWDSAAYQLWRQLDSSLWQRYRNPVEMLAAMDEQAWESLVDSDLFGELYSEVVRRFDEYMSSDDTWYDRHHGDRHAGPIAYLCAEYGVHPSNPGYSGGLGVLAGDHAKSASDLGLPFVGTGLLYRRGYFRQFLDLDGTQHHFFPMLDVFRLPVRPAQGPGGGQLKVTIDVRDRQVSAAVWTFQVGRVPLLLLDTDVSANTPADRPITHALYVRGREMRFVQELVLGVGSVKALQALDIEPATWHVNEGHAAMSILERLAQRVQEGSSLEEATEAVRSSTVFTLHTPVPAGNESFDRAIAEKYLDAWPAAVGRDLGHLWHLASSERPGDEQFDLGALAIKHARVVNGVSKKHTEIVSRDWAHLLDGEAVAVTNGVHPSTWVGRDTSRLLTDTLGSLWEGRLVEDPSAAGLIGEISDTEIWKRHVDRKDMLARFVRGRLRAQAARHGLAPDELRAIDDVLPGDQLTIGFARRFATYKRATLLFHDLGRLIPILTDPERPVQVLFAGKAHPADRHGQALIQQIIEISNRPELAGHIHILEDYDLRMGRFLTQGVDVWLNNPRPPQEASGTSGMKAAMNGGLNLSVADGWWIEGHNGSNGWTFGGGDENHDHGAADARDADDLYRVLADEVVPLYYDRSDDGIPHGWTAMMKEAIASSIHAFSTHRMVQDYTTKAYLPPAT